MKNTLNIRLLIAAIGALVGAVIIAVTSYTGYLAASDTDTTPLVCAVVAVALLVVLLVAGGKLPAIGRDALLFVVAAAIIVSIATFVLARTSLAADVYFIPVNYPASEATALHTSIVGAVGLVVAIVAVIVEGFSAE